VCSFHHFYAIPIAYVLTSLHSYKTLHNTNKAIRTGRGNGESCNSTDLLAALDFPFLLFHNSYSFSILHHSQTQLRKFSVNAYEWHSSQNETNDSSYRLKKLCVTLSAKTQRLTSWLGSLFARLSCKTTTDWGRQTPSAIPPNSLAIYIHVMPYCDNILPLFYEWEPFWDSRTQIPYFGRAIEW
jgi:hypothetical protein